MADEKPLILKDGKKQEMQVGVDTIDPALFYLPSTGVTNVDGGLAASVYLATQILDGGGA